MGTAPSAPDVLGTLCWCAWTCEEHRGWALRASRSFAIRALHILAVNLETAKGRSSGVGTPRWLGRPHHQHGKQRAWAFLAPAALLPWRGEGFPNAPWRGRWRALVSRGSVPRWRWRRLFGWWDLLGWIHRAPHPLRLLSLNNSNPSRRGEGGSAGLNG